MADTVIENLITKLSFEFDEDKLEKFDGFVKSAVKGLTALVGVATGTAVAIFAFTKKIAESNDELGKFAERTGIDIKALQELGYVAELNGGSIDSMNSSLENLSRIASESARGIGAGVEVFGMLGVSVTDAKGKIKDADNLLDSVSDAISGLGSQAEKLEFAQKLGIGGDLLLAIQQGSKAIREQRKEARELGFIIDKDAAASAEIFNDQLLRMQKVIAGVASTIGTKLMKQFSPIIGKFLSWFKVNKAIIQQNLTAFLDKAVITIRGIFNVLSRVVSMVTSLINAMGGLKNTIIAVTGVLLAMNATALLMPILIIAASASILLMLEDIIIYAEGGESAIGKLVEKNLMLKNILDGILQLLGMIVDGWTLIFTKGDEALEGLIMMLKDVGRSITDFFLNPLNKALDLVKKIPTFGLFGEESPPEKKTIFNPNMMTVPHKMLNQGRMQPAIQNSQEVSNSTVNKPNISIIINGGDTDKIKHVVTGVLNQQYSGAQTNLKSQVDY